MFGFDRITFDPEVMGGRACIRGMRITVSLVINPVANGMDTREIIQAYPYLEHVNYYLGKAVSQYKSALERGAVVSVTEGQIRVRLLPIKALE